MADADRYVRPMDLHIHAPNGECEQMGCINITRLQRESAEVTLLRECVDDFISQIDDCKSAHTVCGQFTRLAAAIQENLASASGSQESES